MMSASQLREISLAVHLIQLTLIQLMAAVFVPGESTGAFLIDILYASIRLR